MAVEDKNISYRIYIVAFSIFLMTIAITFKLTKIQWSQGDYLRKLAKERTVRNFVIPANKGNIYSSDGSLLATSIPNYNIRFDAVAPKDIAFEKNVQPLADSLAIILSKPSSFYHTQLRMARANKNRYLLIASDLSYSEYIKIKGLPGNIPENSFPCTSNLIPHEGQLRISFLILVFIFFIEIFDF